MMPRLPRPILVSIGGVLIALLAAPAAVAHTEREAFFPDGSGEVPTYRPMPSTPYLVVCKNDSRARIRKIEDRRLRTQNLKLAARCRYQNIQDAIDAVTEQGTTIYVLPGVYREEPNRDRPECADAIGDEEVDRGATVLSYEQQLACPHAQNLIAVMGDVSPQDDERKCDAPVCDLQIEGTGSSPAEVLITGGFRDDGQWMKLNGIRGDRADGLYLKNFTIELFEFNAVYVLETDGFVIDEVVGRYNDEYAFLSFAVDHGLFKDCEGYNNGDAAVYPGSASDVNTEDDDYTQQERWAIEITGCKAHHNAAGYSGTAGNSVYVHDNDFYANATGIVTDSIFPDHPGLPQDHGWFRGNRIFSNNENYFERYVHSGTCDAPPAERGYKPPRGEPRSSGTVCPLPPVPVGAGMLIAGGNWNLVEDNQVWDNWRVGFMLFSVPAAIRDEFDPEKQFDTSHFNRFTGNQMGVDPEGAPDLNGLDFWWDDTGQGNCWQDNGDASDNAMLILPDCEGGGSPGLVFNAAKQGPLVPCAAYDREDPFFRDPPGCDFFRTPDEP